MNQDRDDQLADSISRRALDPDISRPDWVTAQEWEDIGDLASLERELRTGAAAPPLERDRTAAMLGLIPDAITQLDRVPQACPATSRSYCERPRLSPRGARLGCQPPGRLPMGKPDQSRGPAPL